MKLLIVESPGKVGKIQSILGNDWKVKASVGHVRDLPADALSIDIENGFRPMYALTERGKSVIGQLRQLAANANEVYLATDMDREGEAIAWHLKDALGLKNYKRIAFTEITKAAIITAVQQPRPLNMALVAAQETRRVIDRLVGYRVSPTVGNIFNRRGLSAGRVQTPALGLVVQREIAIRSFVVSDYFDVYLIFESGATPAWCAKWNAKPLMQHQEQTHWTDRHFAERVAQIRSVTVGEYRTEIERRKPPAPFITSSLQQASSVALSIAPTDTMKLAQKLYEQGLITYMRTDNPNLSEDAITQVQHWLTQNDLSQDIAHPPHRWTAKENAQEAHEAIRPTDISMRNIEVADPDRLPMQALYRLIWQRAVASQMKSAEFDTQHIKLLGDLDNRQIEFVAKGSVRKYAGWQKLLTHDQASEVIDDNPISTLLPKNTVLPVLQINSVVTATHSLVVACKTKPPARYTEASLIRELETKGIGRPSTYAAIMQGLSTRQYVTSSKRKLHATELGIALYDVVKQCAFAETHYTCCIEDRLDKIAQRQDQYLAVVKDVNFQLDKEIHALSTLKRELPTAPKQQLKPSKRSQLSVSTTTPKDGDPCPLCKKGHVKCKTVKTGPNAGKPMFGCSNMKCRFFAWASHVSQGKA